MRSTVRDAQREDLRDRIVEAAGDLVKEEGLDGLSMRALAERIDRSPGVIYHHFRDKEDLLRSVREQGFELLGQAVEREVDRVGRDAPALEQFAARGRGYARFALEKTGYFRAMFEMPGVAQLEACPEEPGGRDGIPEEASRANAVELLRKAGESGEANIGPNPDRAMVVGWALIHGLTSLYAGGHLRDQARTHEEFMELVEGAIQTLGAGWLPR